MNGIAVPEEQMQGAIVPGSEAYEQLSAEERALGPRPNNKNIVKFQPGKGKVVEEFSGQVRIGHPLLAGVRGRGHRAGRSPTPCSSREPARLVP